MIGTFSVYALLINLAVGAAFAVAVLAAEYLTRPTAEIETKRGDRGRWRWYAYDDQGSQFASSPVFGYGTEAEAEKAASVALRGYRVRIRA